MEWKVYYIRQCELPLLCKCRQTSGKLSEVIMFINEALKLKLVVHRKVLDFYVCITILREYYNKNV